MKKIALWIGLFMSIVLMISSTGLKCADHADIDYNKTCEPAKGVDEFLTVFSDANTRMRVPLKKKGILKTITYDQYKEQLSKMTRGNERKVMGYIQKADQGCIKASRSNFVVCLFSSEHEFRVCDNAFTPSLTDTACYAEKMSTDDFAGFCSENFTKFGRHLQR